MNKQPEVTAKTKEALTTSFCVLYTKKPIDKITIKEITTLAGYNRSTFYQYFTDVYNLLECVENSLLEEMKTAITADDSNLFAPGLNKLIDFFSGKEIYLKALLGDYGSTHFISRLKRELSLNFSQDNFTNAGKIGPYLFEFHLSTSLSLFRTWIKNEKDISPDELLELIHNLYTKGISAFIE